MLLRLIWRLEDILDRVLVEVAPEYSIDGEEVNTTIRWMIYRLGLRVFGVLGYLGDILYPRDIEYGYPYEYLEEGTEYPGETLE